MAGGRWSWWRAGASSITIGLLGLIVAGCLDNELVAPVLSDADEVGAPEYFPLRGEAWQTRAPDEVGMDPDLLAAAVAFAQANEADTPTDLRGYLESRFEGLPDQELIGPLKERGPMNGLVLRHGYIIAEWGDTARVDMTFSVTKSFLATLAGVAFDRETIPDLHAPVAELVDDGGFDSPHNSKITWHMLLNQTNEWEGVLWDKPDTADRREGRDRQLQEPGTFWEYNDVRVNRTALALLRVFNGALPTRLSTEIMEPIGASRSWRWHGYRNSHVELDGREVQSVSGGGHWGGGMWIASRDLARFGYLHLRRGRWRDAQILSERWIELITTPTDIKPEYGYLWWLNTDGLLWPSAPHSSYAARGGGGNVVWVDPEHDLVVVVRWIQRGFMDGVLQRLRASVEAGGDESAAE